MSSKMIDLHGKIKYIHAVTLGKYGSWTVTLYPDDASMKIITDLKDQGLKNTIKVDEDGQKYVQFKRDPQKMMKGRMVSFAAPITLDKDGKPMDGRRIGWGSDAIVRLEVYKYKNPMGTGFAVASRWDSIKITNLVEFELDKSDWSDEDKETAKSLNAVPEPEPW